MKRNINKFSFFIIFNLVSLLFIIPSKVNALSYESDYVNLEDSVEFSTDEFTIDLEYTVFSNGTPEKSSAITGEAVRKVDNMYYYHYVVYYYNSNKEEIGATDGYNGMWHKLYSQSDLSTGSYFSSFLEQSTLYKNYKLSEIKYYKLFIEPSTKELADNYLYNNSTKLNQNGLDDISDFNTIEMTAIPIDKVNKNSDANNYHNSLIYNGNSEYILNSYDINIVVNENNTLNITEKIGAYFNIEKHGIFRKIPLKKEVKRLDGTISKNRAQISNIKVNDNYSLFTDNGNTVIKIGDANYTLTGQKDYLISYLYNLGKDTRKEYDELYFNLIGNDWDTSISNITFTIVMPKEFESSKLGFSSGSSGSIDSSKVTYNVEGNVINGKYNGTLNSGEALTVRLELPEGYFVGAGFNINIMDYILFLIPIIFLGISIYLWYKFGRDGQVVETVEFYPPQGFNSLEVGFLYKGKAEDKDVVSLLIYLTNKGYIKITETKDESLVSKSQGFKITKLKEYDGNNINEQLFLNGLFTKNSSFTLLHNKTSGISSNNPNEVTSMDLYDNFYITMSRILLNINNKENKNKLFEKSIHGNSVFIILMIIVTYCLITIPPILAYGESRLLIVALLFPSIGFSVLFGMLFAKIPIFLKIIVLIWGLSFGGVPWTFIVLPALVQYPIYLIEYIVGLLCVLGMIICFKYLPKRTAYGNEMLGKLKGFKNFLETAEKEKLEAMIMQDPTYFYNILPYTYVLGISDKWIKKFETILLQAPSWYDSPNSFDIVSFGLFMNSTMLTAQSVMSSSPSSDSDRGSSGKVSSGGGLSGGGLGGGGGGSW